ncbi:Thioredoxin domain-containing protein [Emticicia oligotrophica DSM 17448]|uniref:Thioredoxin n=1 Tax=Emticicia oligotrophica (strain DSM 17448 / CIP 109782 / MTCC 6937 / GPTSA100-15) TaxID=929562 RepID=A0ABM5N2Q7_EMTOG|nr:thioredoxin [Emticicia oligotrophica]AFK03738.1 Thioredoxin domain-containing protein [Emticicia oligotrophica DSM 17448]
MKRIKFIVLLLLMGNAFGQNQDPYLLSINEFDRKLHEKIENAQLVDVRTPEEYSRGHLKRAINLNFNDDTFEDLIKAKLDKSKPVFVYCFSGRRSTDAAVFLRDLGYKEVYDMAGGFAKWTSSSKPYVSNNTTTQPIAAFTLDNLDKIIKENKIILVDFYAEWCGPCKKMNPILNKIADEHKNIKLLKIDAEKSDNIATIFKVDEIPTYVIIKNGKQVWRGVGEMEETELKQVLTKLK